MKGVKLNINGIYVDFFKDINTYDKEIEKSSKFNLKVYTFINTYNLQTCTFTYM